MTSPSSRASSRWSTMSDVLLIRISSEVLERLATRDDTGNRLHVEWTEPDAEGFSTAIISVDYTDNPFADARLELSDYRATFDLRWKADMRAIQRWQAAHP